MHHKEAMTAKINDWKTEPMSDEKELLPVERVFTDKDADLLVEGFVPREMEDKWFICFEGAWLSFYRSWTGHCIFRIRLDGCSAGVRVREAWVTRNSEHYGSQGVEEDIKILNDVIDGYLLKDNKIGFLDRHMKKILNRIKRKSGA